MIEKRKFHRVPLSTRTILSQREAIHHGQLQNISMGGALIRLEHGTFVPQWSEYDLTVYIEDENFPLQFNAEIVSVNFAMAAVKFLSYEDDTETRLAQLLHRLSLQPDKAKVQVEIIRSRSAELYQEG